MNREKEPLYRKENKNVINCQSNRGGEFRHSRNTKKMKNFEGDKMSMKNKKQRGLDYTPLFKFLLSKVGKDWDEVYKEAVNRLDKQEPIFWMVALHEHEKSEQIITGESTYWSGLYVDENKILQKVNPNLSINDIYPGCNCCTHTFNGKVVSNKRYSQKNV